VQTIRGGKVVEIDLKEIVIGDIIYFNISEILSIDGVMISGSEFKAD